MKVFKQNIEVDKTNREENRKFWTVVSIVGLFCSILIIFMEDGHIKSDETKYHSKSLPIYFLNSETNVSGQAIFGSGGISSNKKYEFYLKKGSIYEIKTLNAHSTYIREKDTIPSVKWFYKVRTKTSYIPIFNKVDTTIFLMEKKYNPIITIPKEMLLKLENNK